MSKSLRSPPSSSIWMAPISGWMFALLLFGASQTAAAQTTTETWQRTAATLPEDLARFRHIRGGFSSLFGGLAMFSGARVVLDDQAGMPERVISTAVFAVGTLRLIDGVQNFFRETELERQLAHGGIDLRTALRLAAQRQRRLRLLRAGLLGARSLGAFSLAVIDLGEYWIQLIVGIATGAIAVMQVVRTSPAEEAWSQYRVTHAIDKTEPRMVPVLSASTERVGLGLRCVF